MSREFSIDMIPGGTQTAVHCNQYESGDTWVFALYYDGGRYSIPADAEVSITGTKPDGAAYNIAGEIDDNEVVITVTDQITACAGRSIAEILVESETDGTTLYSANFPIIVEPAAVQGDLSPSEIPAAITDTDGNVYYSEPLDSTLTVAGAAADAKAVGDALAQIDPGGGGGGGSVTVDTALSSTSTNPVQNKKIYEAIQAVQSQIPTVTNDFTNAYKDKVDALWADYQSALTALG